MMNDKQIAIFLDGDAWVEYLGDFYECIGFHDGKYLLSCIKDGYCIYVSLSALKKSSEFFYSEKY